jgi:hypothetical protein
MLKRLPDDTGGRTALGKIGACVGRPIKGCDSDACQTLACGAVAEKSK